MSISMTTMRVSAESSVIGMPKRMRKSASGITLPRTLMTLGTNDLAPATFVTGTGSMISRTKPASSANFSSPRPIMTTWIEESWLVAASCCCRAVILRGLVHLLLFRMRLGQRHKLHHIQDQRGAAVAENGRARENGHVGMQLGKRLDDGLMVADDLIGNETDTGLARGDDDGLLMRFGRARHAKDL